MNRRVVIVSVALALILLSPGKSRAEKVCGGWNNKAHCGAAACAGLPVGSSCGGGMVCYDLGECKEDSDFRYCGCGLGREVPGQAIAPQASLKTTRTLKATLVGFVLPRDTHPGDRVSVGVVLNPKTYSALHGLRVVTAEVPLPESERGHATLNGVVVRPEKAERQAASEGVTYPVPPNAASIALTIAAVEHIDQPTVVSVPIESSIPPGEPAPEQKPGEFTMAPVLTDSPVALVHGTFDGYGSNTRVEVNGAPQSVLTENPHECYFVPRGVTVGINKVTVTEGRKTASFEVFVPKLDIEADRTVLEPSQSTGFLVRVSKLDDMPASAWKAGIPSESYDMDRIASIEPRFAPPAGGEGELLLIITDNTPQVATMNGAQGDRLVIPIKRTDLVNGTKEYRGTLTGVEKGTFNLDAVVVPLVAEVPGSIAQTANPIAGGPGKPDCCQYWNPVVGNTCDDIVNSASCLEKIGGAYYRNSTCQDNGKCSLY